MSDEIVRPTSVPYQAYKELVEAFDAKNEEIGTLRATLLGIEAYVEHPYNEGPNGMSREHYDQVTDALRILLDTGWRWDTGPSDSE